MKRRRGRRGFWWWSWVLALLTIGLTVGGYLYGEKRWEAAPKDYVAVAVLSVDIRKPFEASGVEAVETGLLNDSETKTLEGVQSDQGLAPVVATLGLDKKWELSADDAVIELRSSVDLDLISDTKELTVLVTRHDPVEAAEIANAIARSIPGRIKASDEAMIERETAKLQEEMKPYAKEIEDARLALKAAFTANNIPIDPRPGLDVTPYNQIPAVLSANLAWVEAREFFLVAERGQREVERYLKRKIKPSIVKAPAVPPTTIAGPELKSFQVQTALYGLTAGLLLGSLVTFVLWKLFP